MKIGITGYQGRMGAMLINEIGSGRFTGAELAGGSALPNEITQEKFFTTPDSATLFEKADAIIDFTVPAATRAHIDLAAKTGKTLVIGTTGLTAIDQKEITEAAKKTIIIQSANYSVGVNALLALVEKAAATLGTDWDIEIFESHHKHKIDAPSGTALAIGKAAATGRKVDLDKVADWARHGETGARKEGNIGFSVARGGDVVGEHMAYFYSEGERIELTHVATNRALFARGAIKAALWSEGKKPGLYSMRDVLGL